MASDDDLLKLYTTAPEARSYAPPEALDQYEQDLLKQYTTVPPAAPEPHGSRTGATLAGLVEGLPIVGPYVKTGVEKGAAGLRSVVRGQPYDSALKDVQGEIAGDIAAHPNYHTAGEVVGGVAGTIPMMAAAPGAFGIGAGGLAVRSLAAAGTGAVIGGGDSAVRSGGDLNETAIGAGTGAVLGGLGPGAGKLIGMAGNKLLSPAAGSAAAQNVNSLLKSADVTPTEARAILSRLGPDATLADVHPTLLTDASALAARGGETTGALKTAMQARAASADNSAAQLAEKHLGARVDLEGSTKAIENDAATRAGPHYDAGRASGQPMDVTHILGDIDAKLAGGATGGVENVLNKVKEFLTNKVASGNNPVGLSVPKSDPGSIHAARQAVDDMIEKLPLDTNAGKNAYRQAVNLRNQIDGVVKQNPHYAAGDAIHSQAMGIRDAMQEGVDVFKRNVRQEDLARTLARMSPEQVDAYRVGARQAIQDTMEQSTRGEMAGAQSMFARGTANRAKLDALFPNAKEALDALHAEITKRGTERAVLGNSLTAERQAAGKRYSPGAGDGMTNDLIAAAQGAALGDPTGGIGSAVARRGVSTLWGSVQNRLMDNMAQGTARGLIAVGPEQQAFLAAVERARGLESTNKLIQGGADVAAPLTIHGTRRKLTGR